MLHKCVNPECSQLFRSMSAGKLFQVETEQCDARLLPARQARGSRLRPRVEYYWMCDECSRQSTLTFVKGLGIRATPLATTTVRGSDAAGLGCDIGRAQEFKSRPKQGAVL